MPIVDRQLHRGAHLEQFVVAGAELGDDVGQAGEEHVGVNPTPGKRVVHEHIV